MVYRVLLAVLLSFAVPSLAVAEQRSLSDDPLILGAGRLFTNDYFGDGRDRWQSGSYVLSFVAGERMEGVQPFGSLREYRFRSSVIASDGFGPAPGDRPYAGSMSVGVHTHFGTDTTQSRVGVDVTLIGPRTQLSTFQSRMHDALSIPQVRFTDQQLGNETVVGLSGETAEMLSFGEGVTARPFGEVQIGPEDTIRIGADVMISGGLAGDLLIRDVTTGHLYTGITDPLNTGFSFVIGGDAAYVADSIYLPGGGLAAPRSQRTRGRAGVHWHGEGGASVFYGLTYLGPEYEGQSEGQVTGSLKLNFNF